ncbi:unnamed protein product [Ixodes pacificus]
MGLLHSARGRGALARGLGGQLLTRRLASGRLTGSLLSTGHCSLRETNKGCADRKRSAPNASGQQNNSNKMRSVRKDQLGLASVPVFGVGNRNAPTCRLRTVKI